MRFPRLVLSLALPLHLAACKYPHQTKLKTNLLNSPLDYCHARALENLQLRGALRRVRDPVSDGVELVALIIDAAALQYQQQQQQQQQSPTLSVGIAYAKNRYHSGTTVHIRGTYHYRCCCCNPSAHGLQRCGPGFAAAADAVEPPRGPSSESSSFSAAAAAAGLVHGSSGSGACRDEIGVPIRRRHYPSRWTR